MAKHLRNITEDKRLEGVKKSKVEDGQVYGGADASVQMNDPETVKFAAKHKVEKHEDRVGNGPEVYNGTKQKHVLTDPKNKRLKPDEKVYESVSCNETPAGTNCPTHGLNDCSGMTGKKQLLLDKDKKMNEEIEIDEVLSAKDPVSKWIHDFVHSDNTKFAGKSKKQRQQQALAAYYSKKRSVKEDAAEPMLEGGKKKKSQKEDGPIYPSGHVPNTTQNTKADTGYNI